MNLTGKCGIIFACLTDPFSEIVSKIVGLRSTDLNCVGFYYTDAMSGQYRILLYNVYDNKPVCWMKLGCSKDFLFDSPFVIKIVYYEYNGNDIDFRASIIKTISTNKPEPDHVRFLLRNARLLEGEFVTGYTLVSSVLGCKNVNFCSSLSPPVVISSTQVKITDEDVELIVEQTRKEIASLFASFIDLFTTNKSFNANVTRFNIFNPRLLTLEEQLISELILGVENGIVSTPSINNVIRSLNEERLGHAKLLPLLSGSKTITLTEDEISCTFQSGPTEIDLNPLEDLGIYLNELVRSLEDPVVTSINLSDLISCYNNLIDGVHGTNLGKISYPTKTISKEAVITTSFEDVSISVNSKAVPLTIYSGNFSRLTESQLMDVLIYIDSLRDSSGNDNSKFAGLQNKIIHELALRRKQRKN